MVAIRFLIGKLYCILKFNNKLPPIISALNRADPNLWSFVDDTPKGVTIHKIEEKLIKETFC